MEDNTEDSKYVLTQGKNNPEDWVARGANFMDNKLYDHAAHCYRVAGDDVRRTVALAYARFSALVRKKSRMTPSEYRLEYRQETFKVSKLQLLICDGSQEQVAGQNDAFASQQFAATSCFTQEVELDSIGMQIGHELLAAANQADQAAIAVLVSDRKTWLRHAAKLFMQSSITGCAIAAR